MTSKCIDSNSPSSDSTEYPTLTQNTFRGKKKQMLRNPNTKTISSFNILFYAFLIYACFDAYATHAKLDALNEKYAFLTEENNQIQFSLNQTLSGANLTCNIGTFSANNDENIDHEILETRQTSRDLPEDSEQRNGDYFDLKLVVEEPDHLHNQEDRHGEQQNYLRSQLETSRAEYDSQVSTQTLRDELTSLHQERDFFSKRTEELSLELHIQNSEVEYLTAERAIQDEEISLLHLKLDQYKKEIDSLEDQLDIATHDGDVDDLPILYQELEYFESKNAKLERELAAVKVRVETLTNACELVS